MSHSIEFLVKRISLYSVFKSLSSVYSLKNVSVSNIQFKESISIQYSVKRIYLYPVFSLKNLSVSSIQLLTQIRKYKEDDFTDSNAVDYSQDVCIYFLHEAPTCHPRSWNFKLFPNCHVLWDTQYVRSPKQITYC